MPLGFTPSSGPWQIEEFTTNSSATFLKGSLVALNGARQVVEYASTLSHYLGIALQDSVDSLPATKVQVAIPMPGCTAYADVAPGVTASVSSIGHAMGVGKRGDYMSFVTTHGASVFSKIVTVLGPIITSPVSRVRVAFIQNEALVYSTSSVSID